MKKNLYILADSVERFEPVEQVWSFKIAAALVANAVTKEVDEDDEMSDVGEKTANVVTVKTPRPYRQALADKQLSVSSCPITPGVVAIIADTEGGKSVAAVQMANMLTKQVKVMWITLQETYKISKGFATVDALAADLLAKPDLADVIIIDSFRLYQFGVTGGTTRPGGVSSRFFDMLTELNNAAEEAGICVMVLFNPLAKDEAAAEILNRDVRSSVNTVISLTNQGAGTITSRVGESRQATQFDVNTAAVTKVASRADVLNVKPVNPTHATKSNLDIF